MAAEETPDDAKAKIHRNVESNAVGIVDKSGASLPLIKLVKDVSTYQDLEISHWKPCIAATGAEFNNRRSY